MQKPKVVARNVTIVRKGNREYARFSSVNSRGTYNKYYLMSGTPTPTSHVESTQHRKKIVKRRSYGYVGWY